MAKRTKIEPPKPANLSPEDIAAAIPKLERRIEDLLAFDVDSVEERGDPRIKSLKQKNEETVASIFGTDTEEYLRYLPGRLDTAPIRSGGIRGGGISVGEIREGLRRGIQSQTSNLQTIIEVFEEKLEDGGESSHGRATRQLSSIQLHTEIDLAVSGLFEGGHYANAIEDACKVLDTFVQLRSGRHELSGTPLMQTVFSANNPILEFDDVNTENGKSVQQGMMWLYSGVISAFRNPRAHKLVDDEPEAAAVMILFLDFLLKELDRATHI